MINPKAGEPHWITIVLPNEQEIGGYRYTPRASGEAGVCTDYEIYASNDNVNFKACRRQVGHRNGRKNRFTL